MSASLLQISHTPTLPISNTLAMDLHSSTRPFMPNMRLKPLAGLSLEALGMNAEVRKPNEPSIAGAAMAAMTVASMMPPTGTQRPLNSAPPRSAGWKSITSSRPNCSPRTSISRMACISIGPIIASQPAPAIRTSAVARSRDWRRSPSLAASASFLADGFSVFSPPPLDCWAITYPLQSSGRGRGPPAASPRCPAP